MPFAALLQSIRLNNSMADKQASLQIVRRFSVSPEEVWRAWTDPEAMKKWWGPGETDVVHLAETDVRVGGRFRVVFASPASSEPDEVNDVGGVYREVVPNRKLVFSWTWKSTPERESQVTVTFKPTRDGTELTLLHERFFDAETRDRHEEGWTGALDKLDRLLS